MLTTLPYELFREFVGYTSEDGSSEGKFSIDGVEKSSKTFASIKRYMSSCDVWKVGEGSGRIAYFLNERENAYGRPCCFKVAKNKKGLAQNKAEIDLFTDYGCKYGEVRNECFPVMFGSNDAGFYIAEEAGSRLPKGEVAAGNWWKKYFKEWNNFVKNKLDDSRDYYINTVWSMISMLKNFCDNRGRWTGDPYYVLDDFEQIVDANPKYRGIWDMFEFMAGPGSDIVNYGDFQQYANWGFVVRDGANVLIPIDWGFTKEVAEKYYTRR